MATLADLLQGRASPYVAPVSGETTQGDRDRARRSQLLGYDTDAPWGTMMGQAFHNNVLPSLPFAIGAVGPGRSVARPFLSPPPEAYRLPPLYRGAEPVPDLHPPNNRLTPQDRAALQQQERGLYDLYAHEGPVTSARNYEGIAQPGASNSAAYWRALREFDTLAQPPRNRLNSAAGATGAGGLAAYLQSQPEGFY